MRSLPIIFALYAIFAAPFAIAAETKVGITEPVAEIKIDISSPEEGAQLNIKGPNTLDYSVTLEGNRGRVQIYLDGTKIDTLYQMKGRYTFGLLPIGSHEICLKVEDRNHASNGAQRCIKVTVYRLKGGPNSVGA